MLSSWNKVIIIIIITIVITVIIITIIIIIVIIIITYCKLFSLMLHSSSDVTT